MTELEGRVYLSTVCECSDASHSMRFRLTLPRRGEDAELDVSVQLNPCHPWWRRAWYGLRYAMGKKSTFTHGLWDEGTLSPESAQELVGLLACYLAAAQSTQPTFTVSVSDIGILVPDNPV